MPELVQAVLTTDLWLAPLYSHPVTSLIHLKSPLPRAHTSPLYPSLPPLLPHLAPVLTEQELMTTDLTITCGLPMDHTQELVVSELLMVPEHMVLELSLIHI